MACWCVNVWLVVELATRGIVLFSGGLYTNDSMAKTHKTHTFNTKAFLKIIIPMIIVLVAITAAVALRVQQDRSEREATVVAREAMVHALTSISTPAPVDAHTGSAYFPALRVYLPASYEQGSPDVYMYQIDAYGDNHSAETPVVNISSQQTMFGAVADLYNAQTSEDLFGRTPRAHACVRGATVALSPVDTLRQGDGQMTRKFHHKQTLSDGRELYFYYEPACPGVTSLIDDLAALKPYEL